MMDDNYFDQLDSEDGNVFNIPNFNDLESYGDYLFNENYDQALNIQPHIDASFSSIAEQHVSPPPSDATPQNDPQVYKYEQFSDEIPSMLQPSLPKAKRGGILTPEVSSPFLSDATSAIWDYMVHFSQADSTPATDFYQSVESSNTNASHTKDGSYYNGIRTAMNVPSPPISLHQSSSSQLDARNDTRLQQPSPPAMSPMMSFSRQPSCESTQSANELMEMLGIFITFSNL